MSPKKENRLYKKYPKLLHGMTLTIEQSCLAFGLECGDGWYKLLDAAFEKIKEVDPNARVSQVKEKFGTLRLYLGCANEEAHNLADMAETLSGITCEGCGEPGKLRSKNHWYSTRCDKCWEEEGE